MNQWTEKHPESLLKKIESLEHNNVKTHFIKIFYLILIWLICGFTAYHCKQLLIQVPCWIIIGFSLHGLAIMLHEGAHGSLTRIFWLDRLIGFFCGLPAFFPCNCYRATHLLHHEFENSKNDPDNLDANVQNPFLKSLIYYTWYGIGMQVYILILILTAPFRSKKIVDKIICLVEPAIMLLLYYSLFLSSIKYHFFDILLKGWLMGIPFTLLIANIRGLAEHTQLHHDTPPNQLKSTRTTISNSFISFFFNNQNYHLEHHLFPQIPWYNLPKVHNILTEIYTKEHSPIAKSYTQYLFGAFRYGPLTNLIYKNKQLIVDNQK